MRSRSVLGTSRTRTLAASANGTSRSASLVVLIVVAILRKHDCAKKIFLI